MESTHTHIHTTPKTYFNLYPLNCHLRIIAYIFTYESGTVLFALPRARASTQYFSIFLLKTLLKLWIGQAQKNIFLLCHMDSYYIIHLCFVLKNRPYLFMCLCVVCCAMLLFHSCRFSTSTKLALNISIFVQFVCVCV